MSSPLGTHRDVLVAAEPASCARVASPGLQGAAGMGSFALELGPRLLVPDSAPSDQVAVDVSPFRAWLPPSVNTKWSVLKFHLITCSTFSPEADCYSSRRGGNSPGSQRLFSVIKY